MIDMAMGLESLNSLDEIITRDVESVAILYYLWEKNPNVPVTRLAEEIGLSETVIFTKINTLKDLGLLKVEANKYTLTPRGRSVTTELLKVTGIVSSPLQNLKQPSPKS